MMMIAFITIKSSLVPLIEGLCAHILHTIFFESMDYISVFSKRVPKFFFWSVRMMMMIAFVTINSGLVPLIEGLCAQIYYLRFEIIGGLRSHLLLFFGRENMLQKKAVSPRSHPAS